MFHRSIIVRSKQSWKAVAAFATFLVGCAVSAVGSFGQFSLAPEQQFLVAMGGIVIAIAAGVFGLAAIRCPRCGARWIWLTIRKASASSWLMTLLSCQSCPVCKWRPE